ncbi:hypothetical protein HHI36_017195 [Cryptolaemus montrouzieri]|uniref:Uncharacterized protein n=1 Tax=Cryptolaemus montrouzieri TaxID=559131 RepID=A0ABD2NM85_9CUCU
MDWIGLTFLDLVYTNIDDSVCVPSDDLIFDNSIHYSAIIVDIDEPESSDGNDSLEIVEYDFNKADYNALNHYLSTVDWIFCCSSEDIDAIVIKFHDILLFGFEMFIPKKRKGKVSSYPTWFTKELIIKIHKKKKIHRKYKVSNNFQDYLSFSDLRSECIHISSVLYVEYLKVSTVV